MTCEDKKSIQKYKELDRQRSMEMAIKFVDEMPEWKKNIFLSLGQSTNSKPREPINQSDCY